MAWYDSEAEFFQNLSAGEITLREAQGYFTQQDQQTNAQAGTYRGLSREYAIRTRSGGTTSYVLHTHQDGSWLSAAHVKDGSFGRVTFYFNDLNRLDQAL